MVRNEEVKGVLASTFKLSSVVEYCFKEVTVLPFEIQDIDTNINQRRRMSSEALTQETNMDILCHQGTIRENC